MNMKFMRTWAMLALTLVIGLSVTGGTIAWFTDSVETTTNVIESGNLDVALEYYDTNDKVFKPVNEQTKLFKEDTRWEPGYTDIVYLKVSNAGNLALKYKLAVNVANETSGTNVYSKEFKLSDYLVSAAQKIEVDEVGTFRRDQAMTIAGTTPIGTYATADTALNTQNEAHYYALAVCMPSTVDNNANHKTGTEAPSLELGVRLDATQLVAEEDSFGPDYDAGALLADTNWYDENSTATEFTLKTANDLAGLAKLVNEGTDDFNGKTIKLDANIDLKNAHWTPIGAGSVNDTWIGFNGSFDGQGHTISNLKVTKGGGWNGLFGLIGRGTSKYTEKISNLTIENVVIEGATRMTGAVVGQLYGNLENCHVKNVTITAVPNKVASGYDNGDKIGGIVGWHGDNGNNHYIKGCTAENVTLKAYRDVGGITGYIASSTSVENCKVKDVTITVDQLTNYYGEKAANAGALIGRTEGTSGVIKNNAETNVKIRTVGEIIVDGLSKIKMEEGNEYDVSNANGLAHLNKMMKDKSAGKDVVVKLTDDIDFTGKTWTMVDSHADTAFNLKEIDGQGHTISNLTINGQAMFSRFAGFGDVTIKDLTFDNANVTSNGINTSILTVQSYQNVLLDNVDVKNSSITGTYKVAPLMGSVYNEAPSTITATLKNCDVSNTTVMSTQFDFCTTGMVAFVYESNNDKIEFENCTVSNVKLYSKPDNGYERHAWIYADDKDSPDALHNEAPGVTVTNCTFEYRQ